MKVNVSVPGRPPKRASVGLSLAASHLSQQMKKHRMDNGDYPSGYENGHLSDVTQDTFGALWSAISLKGPKLEKSPLLANGYNHPPTHLNHMQFMQMNHPGSGGGHTAILNPGLHLRQDPLIKPPPIDALARSGIWENCRAAYEDIVKHLERLREERGENERALALDQKPRDLSSHNGFSNAQSPVLNLSKNGGAGSGNGGADHSGSEGNQTGPEDEDEEDDNPSDPDEDDDDKDQGVLSDLSDNGDAVNSSSGAVSPHALNYSASLSAATAGPTGPSVDPASISSTETLLRNIQGLLKVAADNARQQERQINYEKAELKMDVLREREVKDSLERQLLDEQKIRVVYQKRLRKERKARRRLQDQLELEMKRRAQLEEALKAAGAPPEALRVLTEGCGGNSLNASGGSSNNSGGAGGASGASSNPNAGSSSGSGSGGSGGAGERSTPGSGGGGGGSSTGASGERAERSSVERCEGPEPPAYPTPREPPPQDKPWNYSSLELINSGAAFWQNYSETRPGYYKNSVLFSSAT